MAMLDPSLADALDANARVAIGKTHTEDPMAIGGTVAGDHRRAASVSEERDTGARLDA